MTSRVQEYYERNTRRFLRYGAGNRVGAIHRKLWGPGIQTTEQALLFINGWVADQLQKAGDPPENMVRYLDLGCGVGGTAVFIAERSKAKVLGITISPQQARIAKLFAGDKAQNGACRFIVADYHQLPTLLEFQGGYAIEAFAHSTNPDELLKQVSGSLEPGARFVIVDDMLPEQDGDSGRADHRSIWQQRFKRGWRLNALLKPSEIQASARKAGLKLRSIQNFSGFVRTPGGWKATLLKWIARLPLKGIYWQSISAGIALQECISRGWIEYTGLVFESG